MSGLFGFFWFPFIVGGVEETETLQVQHISSRHLIPERQGLY